MKAKRPAQRMWSPRQRPSASEHGVIPAPPGTAYRYDRRKAKAGDDSYMTPELRLLLELHIANEEQKRLEAVIEPLLAELFPPEYYERKNAARAQRLKDSAYRAAVLRRARMLGAPKVEKINRSAIFDRDKGVCHICRKAVDPAKYHLDHVIPLARGGDHTAANLKVAHPVCNIKKGAKILEDVAT